MKKLSQKTAVVFLAIMIAATPLFAVATDSLKTSISLLAVENLKNGILSDNEGLMRSSVYMAGKYKIDMVVAEIAKILFSDTNQVNKELAARALYEIASLDAVNVLKKFISSDQDVKVRNLCSLLVKDLAESKGKFTAYEN